MKTRFALSRSGLPAFVLVLLATLLTVCVTPGTASAQSTDKKNAHQLPLTPPTPSQPDDPPLVWNYLMIGVVFLATLGAALIPSKRGHQD